MKLLKIRATGLKLFRDELNIDFYAKKPVSPKNNEMLTHIFSNTQCSIYINNVMALVGINASGKTTSLKVISFVLQLLQNKPINGIDVNDILQGMAQGEEVCFEIYFVGDDDKLIKLRTVIQMSANKVQPTNVYKISEEKMWIKSLKSIRSKDDLFRFSEKDLKQERNENELFLMDDVSIMIAFNKLQKEPPVVVDSIDWTNFNGLRILGDIPIELIRFLDPSIEYLQSIVVKNEEKIEIKLKFYEKEEIIVYSPIDIMHYLSSGTIKGINIFSTAFYALQSGGYVLIDELENHFNKEIVSTFIRFFMDEKTNQTGAVLVFSTHYVELLDLFNRNDGIQVIRNRKGIVIENLSDLLKRNDVKKSEVFLSGYLEQTAPSYDAYIKLKRIMKDTQPTEGA